jgi:hypothetical protein
MFGVGFVMASLSKTVMKVLLFADSRLLQLPHRAVANVVKIIETSGSPNGPKTNHPIALSS